MAKGIFLKKIFFIYNLVRIFGNKTPSNVIDIYKNYKKRGEKMTYLFSDLRSKEVIHIGDGERLGFVSDIEIDTVTGRVVSISVPGAYKAMGFLGKEPDRRIPWENIKKIGDDLVIIEAVRNRPIQKED